MRLFLIKWDGKKYGMIDVARELSKKHDIIYWTCTKDADAIAQSDFPGTVLHEHLDALHGIPPACPFSVPPASAALLRELSPVESIVLTMMNKQFEPWGVGERKSLYYAQVAYWEAALTEYRPDAIIFPAIPHTVYDFILYALATRRGVLTVMLEPVWVNDRIIFMHDYTASSPELFRSVQPRGLPVEGLPEDLQKYYARETSRRDTAPFYLAEVIRAHSGLHALRARARTALQSIGNGSTPALISSFLRNRIGENARKEYQRFARDPDLSADYLYVPLHYQPERTTSPQGDIFVYQSLMVEILAASVPDGWRIYVKEHPTQWLLRGVGYGSARYRGYYEHLARLRNVELVPVMSDNYELIRHSRAVATVCGTPGFEAVLRGRPVLVFGYPWYQECGGVFKVSSVADASAALKKIQAGSAPGADDILAFLGALARASTRGFIDEAGRHISRLSMSENVRAIVELLERALGSAPVTKSASAPF